MAILNEKFGFVLRDASTGLPTSGQLVELREGSNNYVLTEKATSGFYEVASIPTGKYSAYINSVDSGSTFGVGTGQVAALGNTLNNVAVSTASEFGFQSPSVFKATLDLDLVTNKAIPLAVAADENKIISVNASGNYVLTSPSSTGFAAVFEANSASELEAALGAAISRKTIIITKAFGTFNYATSKTISVYGQNVFYGNEVDFSCGSGIVVDFINDVSDPGQITMQFFNNIVSFGSNGKFVGEIEPVVSIRNIAIVDAQIDDTGPGTSSLSYEKQFALNQTGTKAVSQLFWDNTSGAAGGQVDSVVGGTNCSVDATDPINPIVNADAAPIQSLANVGSGEDVFKQTTGAGIAQFKTLTGGTNVTLDVSSGNDITINSSSVNILPLNNTFTGVNTFSNNINASQLINHADYPTGSTAIGNVWRDGNNLKFRDSFYTKNLTYNASSSLSETTLTVDTNIYTQFALRSQAVNLTIAAPINGLNDGQKLTLRIKDNGVSKTISWNAVFVAIGTTLPLATVAGKYIYVGCIYDESAAKWHVVAVSEEA